MSHLFRGKSLIVPLVITGLGAMTVASAQTVSSPFAKKAKKQAWETHVPAQAPSTYPVAAQPAPSTNPIQNSAQRQIEQRKAPAATPYNYQPKSKSPFAAQKPYDGNALAGAPSPTQPVSSAAPASSAYYPGRETSGGGTNTPQYQAPQNPYYGTAQNTAPASGAYQPGPYQGQHQGAYQGPNQGPFSAPRKQSWTEKLGFGNLKTILKGALRGGIAATKTDDWRDDYVGEVNVNLGVSAITHGGLEYGVNVEARGQYDRYRKGFGGQVGDCPETDANCSTVTAAGSIVPSPLRGHTSQFYTGGQDNAKEGEIALEGAYIFLRSAYGDVTLGRDDGAAYLFSLGAPTLLSVNASNSPLDYTGFDSVKTVNDASGFSEKITYTSPRLLGDHIGIGGQIGSSSAPNARACGVDYCVERNGEDGSGALSADLKDVLEAGLSLDRKFNNGLKVEATASYATAQNDTALAAFDDLQAWNTGLEVSLGDWTAGGSYLQSNNALSDGDYTAWDAGLTWKPSKLGFSASFGQAIDDNVSLKSNQAVLGMSYEFNKFTLGTGVQYIERKTPFVVGGIREIRKEDATALFIEGGFKF